MAGYCAFLDIGAFIARLCAGSYDSSVFIMLPWIMGGFLLDYRFLNFSFFFGLGWAVGYGAVLVPSRHVVFLRRK